MTDAITITKDKIAYPPIKFGFLKQVFTEFFPEHLRAELYKSIESRISDIEEYERAESGLVKKQMMSIVGRVLDIHEDLVHRVNQDDSFPLRAPVDQISGRLASRIIKPIHRALNGDGIEGSAAKDLAGENIFFDRIKWPYDWTKELHFQVVKDYLEFFPHGQYLNYIYATLINALSSMLFAHKAQKLHSYTNLRSRITAIQDLEPIINEITKKHQTLVANFETKLTMEFILAIAIGTETDDKITAKIPAANRMEEKLRMVLDTYFVRIQAIMEESI